MAIIENSTEKKVEKVYKKNGRFLTIKMPAKDYDIEKIQYFKKPVVIIKNPFSMEKIIIAGKDKVGMLSDILPLNKNELYEMISSGTTDALLSLNEFLHKNSDKIIQMNASIYENQYYVFSIGTEKFEIIPFSDVREIVKSKLGEVEEKTLNKSLAWEKKYNSFEICENTYTTKVNFDKLDVKIIVTSGRNTKTSAIKVITLVRIASCNNSIICANFTRIKHIEGWNEKLLNTLNNAILIANTVKEVVTNGLKKELPYETGVEYINNIKFSGISEEKERFIKDAVILRYKYEYSNHKNLFSLSQALSYVGTHDNPALTTDRTLEILQEQAFAVMR